MARIFFSTLFMMWCITAFAQISWDITLDVAPSSSGNNHPRIVTDADGEPMIVWFHANRAMFSKWNGLAFETPVIINPGPMTVAGASWMGPDIASHGDTVYIVFKETPEDVGHIWCVHSYDGGETFSDPVRVDFIADSLSRFPTVTTDDEGHPIVGFMKFNTGFSEARWVVSRSYDFGSSFSEDVLASGWSSPSSVVCDCCPGSVVSADETVVMLYRDNNNNIRDTWAGFSLDGGETFTSGMNIDQQNWLIMACPSTGPDGVIIGDTLYSTFMNGAGGKSFVYMNKTSISELDAEPAIRIRGSIPGLTQQNFPRIGAYDNSLAVAWKQIVNNKDEGVLSFTPDVTAIPAAYDTFDLGNITNVDVAVWDGKIYVVWEDNNSGTVKFRSGSFDVTTGVQRDEALTEIQVSPNPSNQTWYVMCENPSGPVVWELHNPGGRLLGIYQSEGEGGVEIDNSTLSTGLYILKTLIDGIPFSVKVIKN